MAINKKKPEALTSGFFRILSIKNTDRANPGYRPCFAER